MLRCRRLAQNDVHHLETTVGKVTTLEGTLNDGCAKEGEREEIPLDSK